jgi:hypothetical protein
MKILALAVFLAVTQASPPVPRQTADAAASGSNRIQEQPTAKHESANSTLAIETPDSAKTNKNSANSPTKPDEHITVIVQQPTSTSGWEIAYVILTGLLVCVGAVGIGYAIKTLGAIERQAKANEGQLTEIQQSSEKTDRMILLTAQQTENVKKSTDALINSERSWIMTELDWFDGQNARIHVTLERKTGGQRIPNSRIYLVLKEKNEGRTPAWITHIKFWCKLYTEVEPPAIPDIAENIAFSHLGPEPLGIGHPRIDALNLMFEGERTQILSALLVYGVVEYRDVFGEHETWCGYIVRGDPESPRLQRLAGYTEYNKNT